MDSSLAYTKSTDCETTQVPFVLYPVSEINIDDGLGNASTPTFTYKSGRFYHEDRAFHGFGVVTKTRPDSSTETTWYHINKPYWKGRPSKIELAGPDRRILTEKFYAWTKNLLSVDHNGPAFVNVYQDKTIFENNDVIYIRQNYGYNLSNGNLTEITQSGSVGDSVVTETAYVNKGNMISELYYLDGQPSPVVTRTYDEYGNVWKVFDANGNPPTITEYDPVMHALVSKVTNPLGHETDYQHDYQYNKV